ncbi:uncharacterized protein [Nicotiana tomentosiformis]|uniref:uncharacterized protein n=1 Tax=Nicotiana tomentosiformis TaxID=4098 RepID=UPI00388C5C34
MATSGNGGRPFPEDLAVDILLKLPVKTLLGFKCVCKNLYEIMKSHKFIREHMNWNSKNKSPQILIYDHSAPDDSPPITFLVSDVGVLENPPDYLQGFRGMAFLLGSVDGLFLWMATYSTSPCHCGILPPGKLLCGRVCTSDDCSVLSFDFGNEVFVEIGGPDVGCTFNHFNVRLALLDDFIALMTVVEGFVYDIWDGLDLALQGNEKMPNKMTDEEFVVINKKAKACIILNLSNEVLREVAAESSSKGI